MNAPTLPPSKELAVALKMLRNPEGESWVLLRESDAQVLSAEIERLEDLWIVASEFARKCVQAVGQDPNVETVNLFQLADQVVGCIEQYKHEAAGEIERLQQQNQTYCTLIADLKDAAARTAHEPSPDDVRDAERYRWLRTGNDYERIGPMVVLCEADHSKNDHRPFWSLAESALDAAVDKARATATKEPARPTVSRADMNAFFNPDGDGDPRDD